MLTFASQYISAQIIGVNYFPKEAAKIPAPILLQNSQQQAIEICNNGIDDDADGLIDCEDNDCYFTDPNCKCKEINVLWATDFSNNLLWFNVATGVEHLVGRSTSFFTDVTWAPNGKLYGSSNNSLFEIDPNNGNILNSYFGVLAGSNAGLTTDNNGLFYYESGNTIYSLNLTTSQNITVATFNSNYHISGDLAFKDGILLGSAYELSTRNPFLLKLDLTTGTSTIIPINNIPPSTYLLGLVNSANGVVYAAGNNVIYTVDVVTGNATVIFNSTIAGQYAGMTNISAICQAGDTCSISASIIEKQFCFANDTLKASISSLRPYQLTWYLPNGDSVKNVSYITPVQNGLYKIKAQVGNCGTFSTDTFTVNIGQLPNINIGNDTTYCQSFTRTLSTGIPTTRWNTGQTGSSITVNTPGKYWATVSNNCQSKTDTINLAFLPLKVNIGNDTTICNGSTLVLNATTPNATYIWNNNSTNATLPVTNAGKYYVQITQQQCKASDTIKIDTLSAPRPFSLGVDTNYCQPFTRTLSTGNPTTKWSTGQTGSSIIVSTPAKYWATISNKCGSQSDTVNITFNNLKINLGKDTIICNGTALVLKATLPGATYIWNDNSRQDTLAVTTTGTYYVQVNQLACNASDTIRVQTLNAPTPFYLGVDAAFCLPFKDTLATGITTTKWSTGQTDDSIVITTPGKYWATVANKCGKESDTILIKSLTSKFDLGKDTTFCIYNFDLNIDDSVFVKFLWNNGDTTSSITVKSPDIYYATATNKDNCSYTDTIKVVENCDYDVFLPSVFTPNNDGINDIFKPLTIVKQAEIINFKIFDRWNALIFVGNDENNFGWNGFYKNQESQVDSYIWVLEYSIFNNIKSKKGTVTLLR